MSKGERDHFERFEDHTLLKHLVLDRYLKAWAFKLLSKWPEVWFVDAFAGEGGDRTGNPGSPVIAARIAQDTLTEKGPTTGRRAPMRILAIELDSDRVARLKIAMRPYTDSSPRLAYIRQGTLHDRLDAFLEYANGAPVLFFLDPFGVDGMLAADLPKLLSGQHNEIFALFSDVGATRLHATLMTEERDIELEVAEVLASPSLFEGLTEEDAEEKRREVERSNTALRATQQHADRILAKALGPDAAARIAEAPPAERRNELLKLYMRRLIEAGARHVIALPVRDAKNARVYHLVHASKAKPALRTMKEAMSAALRGSSLPDHVKAAVQKEVELETADIVAEIARRFAGQSVRWTEGKDRSDTQTVKQFLLEDTPLFPWQFAEIKQALIAGAFQDRKKPLAFRFP